MQQRGEAAMPDIVFWSRLGLAAFTATLLLAATGPQVPRLAWRLIRGGYVEAILGSTWGVVASTASLLLHAGLAGLLVSHLPLLVQLGGLTAEGPSLSLSTAIARYSAALVLVSAIVLLALRIHSAARSYPADTCAVMLDTLLAATAAAALGLPWRPHHWILGLATALLACYELARGHTRVTGRLLSERLLRV